MVRVAKPLTKTTKQKIKQKPQQKLISLDTETTGLDLRHGACPFLVTICNLEYVNTHFEWEVDPRTRKVQVNKHDVEEIVSIVEEADTIVFHNSKFDVTGLAKVLPKKFKWPWKKTRDTLYNCHLLASNHRRDLTSAGIEYLGIDISQFEADLRKQVNACRNMVRRKSSPFTGWFIAKEDAPGMPSVKKEAWKNDLWLPKAIYDWCMANGAEDLLPDDCNWDHVTATYANGDSATALALYLAQLELIAERKLDKIAECRNQLPAIIYDIEDAGLTYNEHRLTDLYDSYVKESTALEKTCLNIARNGYAYDLILPKGATNNSLREFVFDVMQLEPFNKSKKTGEPSLDKKAIEYWQVALPARSKEHRFITCLREKRQRDTAISYMDSYRRFSLKLDNLGNRILYPSLNATGTDTLRFSSNNPNEQNISKQEGFNLRYAFGPAPGYEWWALDAKNIELRLPAYESGEQELIDLFERPNEPPYYGSTHLLNFHTVYPDIWDKELASLELALIAEFGAKRTAEAKRAAFAKVGPHCKKKFESTWYQYCKNGGFAVQYGAVERDDEQGTADLAFHRPGSHAKLKARFSKLEALNHQCIDHAEQYGYVETIPDKSVDPERGYPLLCERGQWGSIKPTVPLNYHVQGSAMWWMCKAMIRCYAQLQQWQRLKKVEAKIICQVHDELLFQFPKRISKGNLHYVKQLAKLCEKGGDDYGIPTPVSITYIPNNWAEGETIS